MICASKKLFLSHLESILSSSVRVEGSDKRQKRGGGQEGEEGRFKWWGGQGEGGDEEGV